MTVFPFIQISLTQQCMFFLYSILLGVAVGIIYDVFCIFRIALPHNPVAVFFEDLLFCMITSFMLILMIFCANYGVVRWFSLMGCLGGFLIYYRTVGVIVRRTADIIIGFIKKYIISPLHKLSLFVMSALFHATAYIVSLPLGFYKHMYPKFYLFSILKKSRAGFGL